MFSCPHPHPHPARPRARKTGGAVAVVAVVAVILKPITATVDSDTQESAGILLGGGLLRRENALSYI